MRPLPHNFIKTGYKQPFDEVETLLQCVFPPKRRIAPAEGARFSGSSAKSLAPEQRQSALKTLGFKTFGFVPVRIIIGTKRANRKGTSDMRILIVEDERRLAEALGQIMEEQRYQADLVYDGADGLDYGHDGPSTT